MTLRQAAHRHGAHHAGHVNVGQAVGELIHVDVDTIDIVDGVLRVDLPPEPRLSGAKRDGQNKGINSFDLLLQRGEEDLAGVLQQQGGVGQDEGLCVGPAEGEGCANG